MADFDPDAYLAQKTAPAPAAAPASFDPDAYLAQKTAPQEPSDPVHAVIQGGSNTLAAGAKLLDVPRAAVASALVGAHDAVSSHPIGKLSDMNAFNPTNLQKFPTTDELMGRMGVPKGAAMSDVVPALYGPKDSPWYVPEKGGALDFTARGTGGLAGDVLTDPLTYLSMGGSASARAAKEADLTSQTLAKAKVANAGPIGKAADAVDRGLEPLASALNKPGEALLAKGQAIAPKTTSVLQSVAQAPSNALDWLGSRMYGSTIAPVEAQGAKYGKTGIPETLFQGGVVTPKGLPGKSQNLVNALLAQRDKLYDLAKATNPKAAEINIGNVVAPAEDVAAKYRATRTNVAQTAADAMDEQIAAERALHAPTPGSPAIPATTTQVPTGILDANGNPVMKSVTTPGANAIPAIPAPPMFPQEASAAKSTLYKSQPTSRFAETLKGPVGSELKGALAKGYKEEIENSVQRSLGGTAGQDVANLNDASGGLLSSQQGQHTAANQFERDIDKANPGTMKGTDALMFALTNAAGLAKKKAINAVSLGTMPAGYAMRTAAQGTMTGPAIDALTRTKLKNYFGLPTSQGDDNGKN